MSKNKPDWLVRLPDQNRYDRPHREVVQAQSYSHTTDAASIAARQRQLIGYLRTHVTQDELILHAFEQTPRHLFIDQALRPKAYDDTALPIGSEQTISKPSTVAKMLALLRQQVPTPTKILEIGTGCGYQATLLSFLGHEVHSVERIGHLYRKALLNISACQLPQTHNLTIHHADGHIGLEAHAPFDWIILAAAGDSLPQPLLNQLSPNGRLVAPMKTSHGQRLMIVDKNHHSVLTFTESEPVHFVPLLPGFC